MRAVLVVAILDIVDADKNATLKADHLQFIESLYVEGKVVQAGPFGDGTGGMVLYQVASVAEAEAYVRQDPVIREGARAYRLHEWQPRTFPLEKESGS